MQGRKPLLSLVYTPKYTCNDSLLFNLEVSSIHCLVGDAELDSKDDDGEIDTSADVLLDSSDNDGTVSAEEEESDLGAGEGDSDPGEEVSTGIEEEPSMDLGEVELSHPPQTVSPGIQTVVMVVDTIVLVAKFVLGVPVIVDKTGFIVQEIQSDGRPVGT